MAISNRKALITGGAQGMGLGMTELLLENGGSVCILDVLEESGRKVEEELNKKHGAGRVIFVRCDVRKDDEFEGAFVKAKQAFGSIDLVVNNAGVATVGGNYARTIDINLTAVLRGSYLAEKYMSTENGGSGGQIINMASAGGLVITPFDPAYMSSKAGCVAFSRCIAMTYEAKGIAVKCLCPTFVNTTFFTAHAGPIDTDEKKAWQARRENFGILEPGDVIKAFRELVEAEDKNGAVMFVSRVVFVPRTSGGEGHKIRLHGKRGKRNGGLTQRERERVA